MRRFLGLSAVVLVAVLAGCAGASSAAPTPPESSPAATPGLTPAVASPGPGGTAPPAASAAVPTPAAAGPVPAGAANAVERARQDLAGQIGAAPDAIEVVQVTAVDWPDSALGCPQPGRMYSQIVTPGFRIVLRSGGKTYEYHTDRGQRVVSCSRP